MIYRTLKPQEAKSWFAHCNGVFVNEVSDYFSNHYYFDPDTDDEMIFVAMDGDEIASSVRVYQRVIWLKGRAVRMGGIGEVSTKPAYRRQGLAAELLRMAIAAMEARGMPLSILFGNQGIYERAGWRFCPIRRTRARLDALGVLPDGCAVRPFAPEDLSFVMGAYDLYMGRLDGAIVRSETYWRRWVLPQWKPCYVLAVDGQPVGYCCVDGEDGGDAFATELAATPEGEAFLPALLGAVTSARGCGGAVFPAPLLPSVAGEDRTNPRGMMVRLNLPVEGVYDSDALVALMADAGMCAVDSF